MQALNWLLPTLWNQPAITVTHDRCELGQMKVEPRKNIYRRGRKKEVWRHLGEKHTKAARLVTGADFIES